jgi:hypothetical protein
MPATFSDLPPDHPIVSIGPSFVFKNDLLSDDPSGQESEELSIVVMPKPDAVEPEPTRSTTTSSTLTTTTTRSNPSLTRVLVAGWFAICARYHRNGADRGVVTHGVTQRAAEPRGAVARPKATASAERVACVWKPWR